MHYALEWVFWQCRHTWMTLSQMRCSSLQRLRRRFTTALPAAGALLLILMQAAVQSFGIA